LNLEQEAPARGPRRRRNLAQTRCALIDAAAAVFAKKGYSRATLDEIAEEAGFTRGAVHHHFASKEDLFLAVIAKRDEELLAGYDQEAGGSMPPDPYASAARWQQLHGDADSEVALRLELRSEARRSEALRRQVVAVERAAIEATAARLARSAPGEGRVWRHAPELVAHLLHVASHAATEWAVLTGESTQELMAGFGDLVWNGAFEPHEAEE
jgi:AcrR family transcriptional regulator